MFSSLKLSKYFALVGVAISKHLKQSKLGKLGNTAIVVSVEVSVSNIMYRKFTAQ